jgi:hypothetical protein
MAVLSQSVSDIIQIARNVTGRVDANDPMFTDPIMLRYLNDFLQVEHPQEIRIFQNKTWYEFTIDENSADPYPVDLDALSFSTIEPPAYVGGFEVFWYQDPLQFYRIWPETQTYQTSRPTYILYYNNTLTFRNPPDTEYDVKIAAYKIDVALEDGSNINYAYLARYLAYGMSLDIFSDFGEMDKYNEIFPVYRRYRGQVLARTHAQYMNQRATPQF